MEQWINHVPREVVQAAAKVTWVGTDIDGVWTDGKLYYDANGGETKAFHVADGQGVKNLIQSGINIVVISGRDSAALRKRCEELGISEAHFGIKDKLACLQGIAKKYGLQLSTCAYIGDDLPDIPCLDHCGLAVMPANAPDYLSGTVNWVTPVKGGEGAFRYLSDLILYSRGLLEKIIEQYKTT